MTRTRSSVAVFDLKRRLSAEALGTGFLVAAVVGSGIMAAKLAGGNGAIALLCNTLPTGAVLFVIITIFAPLSGAHFNPVVSLVMMLRGELDRRTAVAYMAVQVPWNHRRPPDVRDRTLTAFSDDTIRTAAMFCRVCCDLRTVCFNPAAIATAVTLYITSAYWFTASTSFANPAVTIARSLSDTFAGIAPHDVPGFLLAQCLGALAALVLFGWLFGEPAVTAEVVRDLEGG